MRPVWLFLVVTLSGLAAVPASGQGREWWRVESIQQELDLSAAQVTSLDAAFRRDLRARQALWTRLQDAEAQFDRAVAAGHEAEAIRLIPVVANLRAEQNKARTIMLLRMSWILTRSQRDGLAALRERQERERERADEQHPAAR